MSDKIDSDMLRMLLGQVAKTDAADRRSSLQENIVFEYLAYVSLVQLLAKTNPAEDAWDMDKVRAFGNRLLSNRLADTHEAGSPAKSGTQALKYYRQVFSLLDGSDLSRVLLDLTAISDEFEKRDPVASAFPPPVPALFRQVVTGEAQRRAFVVADCAVIHWILAERLQETMLERLEECKHIAVDPWSNRPFEFRRSGDRLEIRSAGANGLFELTEPTDDVVLLDVFSTIKSMNAGDKK